MCVCVCVRAPACVHANLYVPSHTNVYVHNNERSDTLNYIEIEMTQSSIKFRNIDDTVIDQTCKYFLPIY